MKFKHTFVAAVASIACSAWAQASNVTIYGLAEAGVISVSGYKQGSVLAVNSGIMEGSRWGIRGNEDLGGGWRALVTLESRVELDTGAIGNRPYSGTQLPDRLTAGLPPAVGASLTNVAIGPSLGVNLNNAAFDRQAWVGLVTPVGGFLAGRQYTPAFEAFASFDIMKTESPMSPAQIITIPAGIDIRYNNSLQYRIQTGPWSAAAMMGFGESDKTSANRLLGINTVYKSDRFSVGFGYNTKKNSASQKALQTGVVGASGNFGALSVSGMFVNIKEPNSSSGPELRAGLIGGGVPAVLADTVLDRLKQDGNLLHVGARYDLGSAGHVSVAINKFNDRRASNADITSYGVAYLYPFSKRTNLNFVVAKASNSANAQAALGANGYLGGVTGRAGQDSTAVAVSLRHSF
jgi:predicted porin